MDRSAIWLIGGRQCPDTTGWLAAPPAAGTVIKRSQTKDVCVRDDHWTDRSRCWLPGTRKSPHVCVGLYQLFSVLGRWRQVPLAGWLSITHAHMGKTCDRTG